MGTAPIWGRSRILIVALGLATLLYAALLGLSFLRLPGDGYGIHLSKKGFAVDRAVAGGELQKNDTVIYIADHRTDLGAERVEEQGFDDELLHPGVWYRRIFGQVPPAEATRVYTVLRDGGTLQQTEVRLARASPSDLLSRTGTLFLLGLVFVFNGLFIILRRGDDRAGRLIALALLAEGLNLINNTINLFSINVGVSLFWLYAPIDVFSFWAVFGLLLHILAIFPEESSWIRRHPWALWVIYTFNPLVSGIGGLVWGGGSPLAVRAVVYQLGYPIAGVQLIGALGLIFQTYRTADRPLVRSQIRWILWGILTGVAGWLILYATPIVVTGSPLTDLSLATIPLVAIPVAFTFAVTRYHLLEIDRVINRSLVYGALSVFLVAVYFISVALISRSLQQLTGRGEDTTVVFLSTLTVALVFLLVRDWFQQVIDQAFYPDKLNFQRLLHQVSQELSTTLAFDELITLLTGTIPKRLAVDGAVLYVLDKAEEVFVPHGPPQWDVPVPRTEELEDQLKGESVVLADHGEDEAAGSCFAPGLCVCLPLFRGGRLIGLYGFGAKLSGDPYSGEELQVLRTQSHQVAIAVENTRLYHQVEVYSKSLEDLVRQRTRELEQAHETVAAERNKLDAVLNTITDALVVTDPQGRIILTNPVFKNVVDPLADPLTGLSLSKAIASTDLQTMVAKALTFSSQTFSADLTLGQHIYRASARALRAESPAGAGPDGEISGVVTVLRNVTHEVAVDRMKTDFISIVSHELRTPLTSVLGFAKLIHRTFDRNIVPALEIAPTEMPTSGGANDQGESGDERDKTPSVSGRKLEQAVTRIYENLDIIESESQRLTRLINNVLDIAKMEAGKIEWRKERLDLVQVVRSAVASIASLARERGLPVVVEFPSHGAGAMATDGEPLTDEAREPTLPILWGDYDRLVQVMTNLLSNAVKFTDHGRIAVRCNIVDTRQLAPLREALNGDDERLLAQRFEQEPDAPLTVHNARHAVLINVSDTGIGIATEELATVFEKFKQAGDTLSERPKGSGLGLSICKEIIEHHGGLIWAESEPGAGSIFSFALPISPETPIPSYTEPTIEMDVDAHWVRRRVSERVPAAGDRAPLILVVDDEANIRRLLSQELTDAGYRVIEAADGTQALTQARRQHPDLIILDVIMPDVSGFDVTSALKADERTADIPILILSIVEDRQRGLRLGADEYLTKPVDMNHLLFTIADLLQVVEDSLATDQADVLAEAPGRGKKVLVVDDDVSVVEAITRALRAHGFEVVEAYDPRGAIQRAEAEKPDLVILDAMLSKMNDYELLKALRYQDLERRLNIIVLAGEEPFQERGIALNQALS